MKAIFTDVCQKYHYLDLYISKFLFKYLEFENLHYKLLVYYSINSTALEQEVDLLFQKVNLLLLTSPTFQQTLQSLLHSQDLLSRTHEHGVTR